MRILLGTLLLLCSSCAGFKAVDRGDWRLVWADSAKRDAEAPREVVTRDKYEEEVTAGNRRAWEPPPGFQFPLLHETDTIGMTVGEVQGYRIDEASSAELFVDGAGLELYLGQTEKKDTWKGDIDVTVRESMLYVKATKPGKATLRLMRGPNQKDVPVTVKEEPKKK
ncbi:MAG: hypothetical protein QM817_36200 [Archangium sp.]